MKKLLLLAFICLGLYACKKSDNAPTNATKIIGKWANSKVAYIKTKNGVDSLAAQTPPDSLYLQFNTNGTGSISENGTTEACNYTLSGSTLSLTPTNNPSSSVNFNVRSLTSTDLVLRLQSNVEDGVYYNIDYYFTKQ
jgi:hypothetical protein